MGDENAEWNVYALTYIPQCVNSTIPSSNETVRSDSFKTHAKIPSKICFPRGEEIVVLLYVRRFSSLKNVTALGNVENDFSDVALVGTFYFPFNIIKC